MLNNYDIKYNDLSKTQAGRIPTLDWPNLQIWNLSSPNSSSLDEAEIKQYLDMVIQEVSKDKNKQKQKEKISGNS